PHLKLHRVALDGGRVGGDRGRRGVGGGDGGDLDRLLRLRRVVVGGDLRHALRRHRLLLRRRLHGLGGRRRVGGAGRLGLRRRGLFGLLGGRRRDRLGDRGLGLLGGRSRGRQRSGDRDGGLGRAHLPGVARLHRGQRRGRGRRAHADERDDSDAG